MYMGDIMDRMLDVACVIMNDVHACSCMVDGMIDYALCLCVTMNDMFVYSMTIKFDVHPTYYNVIT